MKPIPLNLLTLYADLVQSLAISQGRGATVSIKTVHEVERLYATERIGQSYKQRYLGPLGDAKAEAEAGRIRRAVAEAKVRKSTVSVLKRSRIPAPGLYMGRLLEVLAEAGLFERGAVLVGTAAYQLFPCVTGCQLGAGFMTQDADLAMPPGAAVFVASEERQSLELILQRADPSFEARMSREDKWPKVFVAASGFKLDLLTVPRRASDPVPVRSLSAAAEPLRFMEYLLTDPIEVAALYGSGVLVRVPSPQRYGVHKLIVAGQRSATSVKAAKDLLQARELFEALSGREELADAIADARERGPVWRRLVDAGLAKIGRGLEGETLEAHTIPTVAVAKSRKAAPGSVASHKAAGRPRRKT